MSDEKKENWDGGFLLMVGVAIGLVFGFLMGLGIGEGNKDIGWKNETHRMGLSEFYVDERNVRHWRWKKDLGISGFRDGSVLKPEKKQGEQDAKSHKPSASP